MTEKNGDLMEKIVSLCKRRGFIYPSSEIYGGMSGFWDYGHYGNELLDNIKKLWWRNFVSSREDIYGIRTSIVMNPQVWEASGHATTFDDPMEDGQRFNVMFKTSVGAGEEATTSYLRPETAQGMFVNFKNTIDSFHPKLPFGIAQIGKAFRNEISPRDFIFRSREFEQMELEYFVREKDWEKYFQEWLEKMREFGKEIGITQIVELDVPPEDRAHYSKRTIDFEFDYPFGRKELWGLAYRTDYDLRAHSARSGTDLEYFDEETGDRLTPHVIEPSLGVDRTVLAVLASAYTEDELGGEKRVYLKLNKNIAPVRAAVFPLLKNKPELVSKAREVYLMLKKEFGNIEFDDNGNIGKRYRRQDEIGTPHCITIDFDTLTDDMVTIRDRDTGEQERVRIDDLKEKLQ
ncbi:MAG: glycyl-tRNA ligase, nonfunctional [Parcubacteria group bacterium GW2011_GWB1_49_7]|uniref:Glycine--tRNA ligase n=1 Tax=Candidatus Zambryskibacteria bacterium RIFCSPHIGHO2_01_FULL_46_25 TaxID=1802738 RepID=A0A1G2T0J3_9BACT|nr:MAG: glycyl-tRNA ligase, nonfunctional [Parcubacteria group bacterium GW2011_GWA1_47_10]KKW09627.1 MAG: glycyl-tRNA ligase, nonfunctional [Parcubacteria group bacterium GW2011_GWB1_49_7]OHA90810.1 MAG: glycine--tRNA ligase [Candidatus Zambryskibacteria bacterium RIFCSPHIGHO2_01_FULL_46_25]OHB00789.1 MAG: glycine--tRNA ligase [Candidatus Zambryskibacteria bacterium RIFCSPHIGHO2_12_FULL_48_10]OHB07123.1 MAG: glycine--tRNA ligase [Candidatus Zambryskibacteria bacterium RIFCSPLOWO2_01_FULL_48_25